MLIAEEFVPRKIDMDIFRDVDGPGDQWSRKTNYYDRQEIKKIVDFLGKDEEEKHVLIKLIDRDAQRFYGSNGAPYIQNVKPMLEEMDECIYHEYNDAFNQAIAEAEIEELKHQGDLRPLQARIAELEKEVAYLKEQQPDEYVTDEEVRDEWMKSLAKAKALAEGSTIQNKDVENKRKYPIQESNISLQQQLDEVNKTINEQAQTIKEQVGNIESLKHQIEILQADIEGYKDKDKRLNAHSAALISVAICKSLGWKNSDRQKLWPFMNILWAYSQSTSEKALREDYTQDEADKLAEKFMSCTPNIAKIIRELPKTIKEENEERLRAINPNINNS